MTIHDIIGKLILKQMCISDFVHDALAMDNGIINDEISNAKIDSRLFEIACDCLRKTNIYFQESNPEDK